MKKTPHGTLFVTILLLGLGTNAAAQVDGRDGGNAGDPLTQLALQDRVMTALNTVAITDVPADHWAKEAVGLMTQKGLITGYPDATFRGNQNLTRYQAALVLARMLPYIAQQTQVQIDGTLASQKANATGTAAAAALTVPTPQGPVTFSETEVKVLRQGLASVSDDLKVVQQQIATLSSVISEQSAEIKALKEGHTDDQGRISKLEGELIGLREQIASLTSSFTTLGTNFDAYRMEQAQAALQTNAPSTPTLPADVAKQPDVTFAPQETVPAKLQNERLSAGLFVSAGGPSKGIGGVIDLGLTSNSPIKAQIYAQTSLSGVKASGLGLNAVYEFGKVGNDFKPYGLVGVGASFSESWDTSGTATDIYARAGAGVEYAMANTVSVFADGYANYYFTNKGIGTGLTETATKGPSFGARLGVKLRF